MDTARPVELGRRSGATHRMHCQRVISISLHSLFLAGGLPALVALVGGCGGNRKEQIPAPAATPSPPAARGQQGASTCPATATASSLLPGVTPAHLRADYWLERIGADHDLDEVLLSPADIRALDASMQTPRKGFFAQRDLLAPFDAVEMRDKLAERFAWFRDLFAAGDYVQHTGAPFTADILRETAAPVFRPALHVALGQVPFFCAPTPVGFFAPSLDLRIDRNRCSTAHAQEVIQVLAPWPGGMQLARTRYTWGFIPRDAPLSPPIPAALAPRFVHGPFSALIRDGAADATTDTAIAALPAGTLLPHVAGREDAVHVATAQGFVTVALPGSTHRPVNRALTRRAIIEEAFAHVGKPYGFGGKDGGLDCSRLVLDIFETFGIRLPRHSSWQSRAGSYSIDVAEVDEAERLLLMDAAAEKSIVLLHLPGHIMLYLGRDHRGQPMALHAFAEYMVPCAEGGESTEGGAGGETLYHVDQVQVSDLELGRGTSKTALIERITRITAFGGAPGIELGGVAEPRPAAPVAVPARRACGRMDSARLFVSPARPDRRRALRVVATAPDDPGAVALTLVDPDGARHTPALVRLGGPPHGYVATVPAPARGRWMAVLGDGERIDACRQIYVHSSPGKPKASDAGGPIWPIQRSWDAATEDLYAIFIERLFDYPPEEDLTWTGLHTLLQDRERNVLHDHLGLGEDDVLTLMPDCADLPYTLRAYFAWKLGLPFGYRSCGRARDQQPPRCRQDGDNLMARSETGGISLTERDIDERMGERVDDRDVGRNIGPDDIHDDVTAFARFVDRGLRRAVHSSSGRTHPAADDSDFYPVPLTRDALRPGTLFTDPYGHLLIIADWIPQGPGRYGVLVGADAQPDGTVGRRRFWRGSFLFDPDTASGGAGFKAFRPLALDPASGALVSPSNQDLRRGRRRAPYSEEQYRGSADDFYDAMHALINPRPLDPVALQVSLVDALEETVSRRATSVATGEAFMRERGFAAIDMPEGAGIFLTTGPWEDYATPSRDLRLLISIDTVMGFAGMVARAPARFGVADADAEATIARLRQRLAEELAARTFRYTRSDGSAHALTLAEVVRRQKRLEMAYNPNDCIEIRWGAAPGADELATCKRHAPAAQRARMERYRPWFETRKRPAN